MITNIIRRLKYIEKSILKNYDGNNSWVNFIRQKIGVLNKHLKVHFKDVDDLKEKKSMILVFQMAPGYKEIYKKYILLNKGLDIGKDLYKITPKKIYKLYEVWCYLKLHNILKDLGYEVTEYGIAKFSDNGLYFSLLQNEEAKMIYMNDKSKLELWYNKSYSALPTTNQRPGTVLCIKNVDVIEYKRSECREIECRKGTENEEYIRINLEWIKEIPKIEPIQYGTQVVTYTTLYLLLNAQNTHELKYKSNLEVLVYKKIKRITDKYNYSIKKIDNNYRVNNRIVQIIEDRIIKVDGWIVKFSELENYF